MNIWFQVYIFTLNVNIHKMCTKVSPKIPPTILTNPTIIPHHLIYVDRGQFNE